jgi:hypothetical protein
MLDNLTEYIGFPIVEKPIYDFPELPVGVATSTSSSSSGEGLLQFVETAFHNGSGLLIGGQLMPDMKSSVETALTVAQNFLLR